VVHEHGKLHIRVQRAAGAPGLTVVLPDGELEDIGTTFSVEVAEGRTRRVHVEDGSVLLELDAHSRVTLRAGQTWSAPPLPAADAAEVPEPISPPLPPAPTPPAAVAASAASPGTSPPPSPEQIHAASSDFRAAMAALHAGDAKSAAAKFQRFVAQYPSDPRAEDTAYLRVLALDRPGDVAGRQAAARAYLGSYPTGFRRAEVERLAPCSRGTQLQCTRTELVDSTPFRSRNRPPSDAVFSSERRPAIDFGRTIRWRRSFCETDIDAGPMKWADPSQGSTNSP
jgi:hypothetical protein